jgi:hypothetical protein
MTSAGVRMAHETSSARDEAAACTSGVGRMPGALLLLLEEERLSVWSRDLVRS